MLRGNTLHRILIICSLCSLYESSNVPMHSVVLDKDGFFWVHWHVEEGEIVFNIEAKAKGYVGFGLSKTGAMAGSDIVTAWVKDGRVHFQDRHAKGQWLPSIDKKEDWVLESGHENDSHTSLKFRRKLNTCDDDDMEIDESTIRLIYAYSDTDPASPSSLPYHGLHRGSRSVLLLQPTLREEVYVPDVSYWDIRSPNFTLPFDKDSIYWCYIVKAPDLPEKNHIIKIEPLIQAGHEKNVHHVVLYECADENGTELEQLLEFEGHACYHPNMPLAMHKCDAMITAWGVGGEALVLPEQAGIPLKQSPPKYYLVETHYDNPALQAGIKDASGLRVVYTPHLRKYDAGTLMIGAAVSPRALIPPGQPSFTIAGHSHPKCFDPAIADGEIKLLGTLLHAHLLGRHLIARHFRGNVELPPLAENAYYDFNYQEYVMFTKEVIFKKGDQITMECTYNSTNKNGTTYGGLFTKEEMCLAFILYYPRIERFGCMSVATVPVIKNATGIDVDVNRGFNFARFYDEVDRVDWSVVNASALEASMRYTQHDAFCLIGNGNKESVVDEISYPEDLKPYTKTDICIVSNLPKERESGIAVTVHHSALYFLTSAFSIVVSLVSPRLIG